MRQRHACCLQQDAYMFADTLCALLGCVQPSKFQLPDQGGMVQALYTSAPRTTCRSCAAVHADG